MLIIRRKQGEAILIGDNIELRVVEVSSGRVTLGIAAPADVLILREEIRVAGQQNLAAARATTRQSFRNILKHLPL